MFPFLDQPDRVRVGASASAQRRALRTADALRRSARSAVVASMVSALTCALAAWIMSVRSPSSQSGGSSGSNSPVRWPRAINERSGSRAGSSRRRSSARPSRRGLIKHQAAVVADHLPGALQCSIHRLGSGSLRRMGRLQRCTYLADRPIGEGIEKRLAAGEVVVEGRPRDASVRRDLLEADERIGGQQLGRGVQEPPGIPASVGAAGSILKP